MGLEVNVDKTKYQVKFREQSARVNQNQKTDNITFERWNSSKLWEQF